MKIKVCGLKHLSNIHEVTETGVDMMGLIFYKNSVRYVDAALTFDDVRKIDKKVKKTGVFVNEDMYSILNTIAHYDLDVVQLHGNESPEYCSELRTYIKIIKAFGINKDFNFDHLDKYIPVVDYFLFDTGSENFGGTGQKFDHDLLKNYRHDVPFFLSGGISLEDAGNLKRLGFKQLYGIDINSKFESAPGIKDAEKIKQFILQLK